MAKLHTSLVIAVVISLLAPSHARLPFFSFSSLENLPPSPLPSETWFETDTDLIPADDQHFTPDAMPTDYPVMSQPDIVMAEDLKLVITHEISFRSINHYSHHQMQMTTKQQTVWSRFPPHHGKHLVGPRDMILGDEKGSGEMVTSEHLGRTFDQPRRTKPHRVEVEEEVTVNRRRAN